MKIIVISSLLILLLLSFENAKLTKIDHSIKEDREEMRGNYNRYDDSALNDLNSLSEEMAEIIKTNLETEILMEKIKTNPSIEYTNCSHLDAVEIELIITLKQGEEKWNEYWNNQEADLSKNEIKKIKEYIIVQINN